MAAEYLAGESGIFIIIGYGLAAAWLLRGFHSQQAERRLAVGDALAPAAN